MFYYHSVAQHHKALSILEATIRLFRQKNWIHHRHKTENRPIIQKRIFRVSNILNNIWKQYKMNGALIRNSKLLINWTFNLGWPDIPYFLEQYHINAQYSGIPNMVSRTVCCPRLIMSSYYTSKFWTVLLLFVYLVISQHSTNCWTAEVR